METSKCPVVREYKKGLPLKVCSCGHHITGSNAKWIGEQKGIDGKGSMNLYNCPKCGTTKTIKYGRTK